MILHSCSLKYNEGVRNHGGFGHSRVIVKNGFGVLITGIREDVSGVGTGWDGGTDWGVGSRGVKGEGVGRGGCRGGCRR